MGKSVVWFTLKGTPAEIKAELQRMVAMKRSAGASQQRGA